MAPEASGQVARRPHSPARAVETKDVPTSREHAFEYRHVGRDGITKHIGVVDNPATVVGRAKRRVETEQRVLPPVDEGQRAVDELGDSGIGRCLIETQRLYRRSRD